MSELEQEENRRFQNGTLFPVYHGSAKNNLGIRQLIEVIASKFYSSTPEGQSELCGQVFKIEYSEKRRRFVYVRIYSGTLHLRDEKPFVNAQSVEASLEDVFLYYFGEKAGDENAAI